MRSPGPEIIRLGPFLIRWYGLLIALSVLIGLNLSRYLAKTRRIDPSAINDLLPILVLSAIIGARSYYVFFEWSEYKNNLIDALKIWNGGIAIHGALLSGSVAVLVFSRIKKIQFWNLLDILLPSVSIGQCIGRWGNFFNNEAFGVPTEIPWKLSIPYINRPEIFSNYEYFHPTFLYESLWNLGVFIILMTLFALKSKKSIKLPEGAITCIYLITYSLGRFWIEGLRVDPLCIGAIPPFCEGGIRIAQLVSILLVCLGSIGLFWLYKNQNNLSDRKPSKSTR